MRFWLTSHESVISFPWNEVFHAPFNSLAHTMTAILTLRERLRTETHSAHHQLDSSLGDRHLFDSVPGYAVYLRLMFFLHASARGSLEWLAQQYPELDRHPPLEQLLNEDLSELSQTLGLEVPSVLMSSLGGSSPSDHWGRAYVLEGSVMGATHLYKTVRKNFPEVTATRYLAATPHDAKHRWPVFIQILNEQTGLSSEEAITAALNVFEDAHRFLAQIPCSP